jgi:putative transposase
VFRLYPTPQQEMQMAQIVGACRLVYNLAFEQRRDWWRQYKASTGRNISFAGQCRELTELRAEVDWLKSAPVHTLQQALRDLDRAYQNFFAGRAGYPTPRRSDINDSFRFPDPLQLIVERTGKASGRAKLPKLGWVRLRGWCELPGNICTITVSRPGTGALRAGRYAVTTLKLGPLADD